MSVARARRRREDGTNRGRQCRQGCCGSEREGVSNKFIHTGKSLNTNSSVGGPPLVMGVDLRSAFTQSTCLSPSAARTICLRLNSGKEAMAD